MCRAIHDTVAQNLITPHRMSHREPMGTDSDPQAPNPGKRGDGEHPPHHKGSGKHAAEKDDAGKAAKSKKGSKSTQATAKEAAALVEKQAAKAYAKDDADRPIYDRLLPGLDEVAPRLDEDVQSALDFDNPRLEGRRLFSEAWGTFLLVLVAAGGGVVGAQAFGADLTLATKALAPGMMVMAIIFFMGTVSGAHLNPAVTLAFSLRGNFPWKRVPGYIVAQFIGAMGAALLLQWMFGDIMAGATVPGEGVTPTTAMLMEALLTAGLVSVILGTASGARNIGIAGGIAVGAYIGLVSVWGAPVSGASMNPMRSLAPDLVGGDMTNYWIYVVGPLLGAFVAVVFEFILRGAPTASGAQAAEGILSADNKAAV